MAVFGNMQKARKLNRDTITASIYSNQYFNQLSCFLIARLPIELSISASRWLQMQAFATEKILVHLLKLVEAYDFEQFLFSNNFLAVETGHNTIIAASSILLS